MTIAEVKKDLKELEHKTHNTIHESYLLGKSEGYNKAIDDFIEKIQWEYLNGCGIKQSEIEFLVDVSSQVAEQLKKGVEEK